MERCGRMASRFPLRSQGPECSRILCLSVLLGTRCFV